MTVVATIITRHCTAHAADSFLTERRSDGSLHVSESAARKLVRVEAWRGVISYWGLARHSNGWKTVEWLRRAAGQASRHSSAQEFAKHLSTELTAALSVLPVRRTLDRGLGLHFTAYESIGGRWVPELFHIRNWRDENYTSIDPGGFRFSRETFAALTGTAERSPKDATPGRRLQVYAELRKKPVMLQFCNGDPGLFMPIAHTVLSSFIEMSRRGLLADRDSMAIHRAIVSSPVELVSHLVRDFVPKNRRQIGGRTHCVAVSPLGTYESETGD